MTLEVFLEKQRTLLVAFEAMWQQGSQEDPDSFPADLPDDEWAEQLLAFEQVS